MFRDYVSDILMGELFIEPRGGDEMRRALGTEIFLQEYRTINFNYGRCSGKTYAGAELIRMCVEENQNAIMLVMNQALARHVKDSHPDVADRIFDIGSFTQKSRGNPLVDNCRFVIFDEPNYMNKNHISDAMKVLARAGAKTIVRLG